MSHWNYRVVRDPDNRFGLYEVYYDDDGRIEAWCQPNFIDGYELATELLSDLCHLVEAFARPTLRLTDTDDSDPILMEDTDD